MKYKVGDNVVLKTVNELSQEFEIVNNSIQISNYEEWKLEWEQLLPENRIVKVCSILDDIFAVKNIFTEVGWGVSDSMIKGYANEYYLQQIKEEMEEHEKSTKRRK